MITIKKVIWIVASIIVMVTLIFSYSAVKKQLAMKQIKEIHSQEQTEKKSEDTSTNNNNNNQNNQTNEEKVNAEDPIRDYVTEKVNKARDRLFHKDIKITAIGDSLTQGVGDEANNHGYVGILEDTINQDKDLVDIDNYGKRGNRTDQLLVRMEEPEIEESLHKADIILITIGANDIMQIFKENFTDLKVDQFASEKGNYENRLHEIFSTLETDNPRADIYLIGFYNPFKNNFGDIEELETIISSWNTLGKEITDEYDQVSYIPTADLYDDTSTDYFSEDHFHPNHSGYELMAERVLEYVVNEGDSDEQET